jgi:uncharacterized OsmC-like protein
MPAGVRSFAVGRYRLPVPEDKRDAAMRARAAHQRACPVARSIGGSIDIETELELV